MKYKHVVKRFGVKVCAVTAGLAATTGVALADAAGAAADLEGRGADIELIGWASIGLLIAIWGFKYLRRAG